MKLSLASTAELYREHRRTQSRRKKEKIADELQRRHDEQNGGVTWRVFDGYEWSRHDRRLYATYLQIQRYNFRLLLS
jgi:hypothetical protein